MTDTTTHTATEIALQRLAHDLVRLTELPLTRELAAQIARTSDELTALAEAA
ncbi:hypothetical protein [Thioclava sp. DLFJ5-1]|uniref:hypothetical protein n=1 Tax=Thioclava sp. DLFJ5-1 TaxID=1915314 RepID=UPI001438D26E|nr:hypothetical protein [Thioclava sp. DLFJ5-1]